MQKRVERKEEHLVLLRRPSEGEPLMWPSGCPASPSPTLKVQSHTASLGSSSSELQKRNMMSVLATKTCFIEKFLFLKGNLRYLKIYLRTNIFKIILGTKYICETKVTFHILNDKN